MLTGKLGQDPADRPVRAPRRAGGPPSPTPRRPARWPRGARHRPDRRGTAGRFPGPGAGAGGRADPAPGAGTTAGPRRRSGGGRVPARGGRRCADAALGPPLSRLPHPVAGRGYPAGHPRARALPGVRDRLRARLRQLGGADLPGPPGDPRDRAGDLLHRRPGALAARGRAGAGRAGRAARARPGPAARDRTSSAARSSPSRSTSASNRGRPPGGST